MAPADSTLTLEALGALAAAFRPCPRIIVGMPIGRADQAFHRERDGLLLLGRVAWMNIQKAAAPAPVLPRAGGMESLSGIRVEFYGDSPDHPTILREIIVEWLGPRSRPEVS